MALCYHRPRNAPFSTHLESILWRLSSVAITSTGAIIALGFTWAVSPPLWMSLKNTLDGIGNLVVSTLDKTGMMFMLDNMKTSKMDVRYKGSRAKGLLVVAFFGIPFVLIPIFLAFVANILFDLAVTAIIIFYTMARVYLVVEYFINVAHLPDGAYQVPQWSQYVPHIA